MGFHRSLEKSRGGGERGDKKLLWCQEEMQIITME